MIGSTRYVRRIVESTLVKHRTKYFASKQFSSSKYTYRCFFIPSSLTHRYRCTSNSTRNHSKTITPPSRSVNPIVELREYELFPSQMEQYIHLTSQLPDIVQSPVATAGIRLIATPQTGWKINTAAHFHYFEGGFEERTKILDTMASCPKWNQYNRLVNTCMMNIQSSVFVEAPFVYSTEAVCGLELEKAGQELQGSMGTEIDTPRIYEIRRYQLKLGYDTVPTFLQLYEEGLSSKLNAKGTDPSTTLMTLLYSDVGALNTVIEIWRHGDTSAMERSRVAARTATEWRDSIAQIATLAIDFTTSIYRPVASSPLR